jgi:hypothetical protein
MTDPRFRLEDDAFWTDPYGARDELDARLGLGLFVGGPAFVALDRRDTLPVLAYQAATFAEARAAHLASDGVACAVDLTTQRLHAGKIAVRDRALPIRSGAPASPGRPPRGSTSELRSFDLRARAGLPWYPTTLVVRLVLMGQASPPVVIELGPGSTTHDDPEARAFVAAARTRVPGVPVSPAPGDPLPRYGRTDDSPPIPRAGLALAARGSVVHGAFRVVARRADLRATGGTADATRVNAVLPISLLLTGTADPVVLPMGVPSYDVVAAGHDSPEMSGHFSVDLRAHPALTPGESYFVRALHGADISGAVTVVP